MVNIIVYIISGLLAGIGIGLVGLSAASIIPPILIVILGLNAYEAIGIALSADVLASGVSTLTYLKNKNVDIKNGTVMMIATVVSTYIASYFAKFIPNHVLGGFSVVATLFLGIKLTVKPINTTKGTNTKHFGKKKQIILSIIWGTLIGIICGIIGAGGGVMTLLVLTSILGYDLKTAVGTSIFIMTFNALSGAIAHIIHGGTNVIALICCVIAALITSRMSAKFANKVNNKTLNKITGIFLLTFSVILIFIKFFGHTI
ncbi:TSUP family transporter [Clostridium tarantellae]|uniref:Probable membrane transporter protein n=1 Tax=Clostridium tarantellae TaxID=39493 RepID=A0A6I1MMN0_9CLOT|nr:TSUP family transporter [Clostridium tarantellae]